MCDLVRRALTDEFLAAGLGVASDIDGTVYRSDVFHASIFPGHPSLLLPTGRRRSTTTGSKLPTWQRPVLVLINVRLGLDRVNPTYYDTIKVRFFFLLSFFLVSCH